MGRNYRNIDVYAVESDGWIDINKTYECIFVEQFGLLGATHTASLYQIQIDDQIYGKKDGELIGDMATHLQLNEAVERAMH